jgi:hypothetical protein
MEYGAVVWVNAGRLVVSECTIGSAYIIPGIAADIVGLRVIATELNRLIEVGDRSVEITTAVCSDSPLSMEFGIVRGDAKSRPVIDDDLDAGTISLAGK